MDIDQNMLVSCITFNPSCTKCQKNCIFDMNFIKIAHNHSFTKMGMKISYMYTSCIIWQYHLCDMYIHWHTIGFIGVTELGTVTFHLAPNRHRFHLSISRGYGCVEKKIFVSKKKFSLEHSPFLPLYSLNIFPVCHCWGISFDFAMLLKTSQYIPIVLLSASTNISLGISSRPIAFPLFYKFQSVIQFIKGANYL